MKNPGRESGTLNFFHGLFRNARALCNRGSHRSNLFQKTAPRMKRSFAKEAEPAGEPWDEGAAYDLFPKLSAKYKA